jgi:hypothetical protein
MTIQIIPLNAATVLQKSEEIEQSPQLHQVEFQLQNQEAGTEVSIEALTNILITPEAGKDTENKKQEIKALGPECQSFKQKRTHPYSGIRPIKSKSVSILSAIKSKGNLSAIKNFLNESQAKIDQINITQQMSPS